MTIRGGGNPNSAMAAMPLGEWTRRLGALPAEAYDCFMVETPCGFNRIQAWFARLLAANGTLPSDHGGRAYRSDPYRRASNLTGRSKCVNQEAPKDGPRVKRIAGGSGVPSCSELGEGHVDIDVLDQTMIELPGVREDGMLGRNGQRKPGTTRGSPRRSRTAKALRISRQR